MGCCQSSQPGQVSSCGNSEEGAGDRSKSITTPAKQPESPFPAASAVMSRRHEDESSMDEVRRNYLQGQLKVDDRCPLTDRQLYCLIKSWKAINRNMTVTAINMFVRQLETLGYRMVKNL